MEDRTLQVARPDADQVPTTPDARVPAVILYDGDEIGELHSLSKNETIVGRTAGNDVVVPAPGVSRRHFVIRRLTQESLDFEIVDLDSTNGTRLNGESVDRAVLRDGDKIGVGDRILKFALLDRADMAYQLRIANLTHIDDLTGLLTVRSARRALEKEMARALRYRRPVSILMMDLDHFKQVNDTYGHAAGSHCLAEVGRLIRESTRVTDVSGRYGGEEFITILPETETGPALVVGNRIRQLIGGRTYHYGDASLRLRISIGIATAPTHGNDATRVIEAADAALYIAKRTGRDRCCVYEPESAEGRPAISDARSALPPDPPDN